MDDTQASKALRHMLAVDRRDVELGDAELVTAEVTRSFDDDLHTLSVNAKLVVRPPGIELVNHAIAVEIERVGLPGAVAHGTVVAREITGGVLMAPLRLPGGQHTAIWICEATVRLSNGNYKLWTQHERFEVVSSGR